MKEEISKILNSLKPNSLYKNTADIEAKVTFTTLVPIRTVAKKS